MSIIRKKPEARAFFEWFYDFLLEAVIAGGPRGRIEKQRIFLYFTVLEYIGAPFTNVIPKR